MFVETTQEAKCFFARCRSAHWHQAPQFSCTVSSGQQIRRPLFGSEHSKKLWVFVILLILSLCFVSRESRGLWPTGPWYALPTGSLRPTTAPHPCTPLPKATICIIPIFATFTSTSMHGPAYFLQHTMQISCKG